MKPTKITNRQTKPMEVFSYGTFYFGQNLLWGFAGFLATFLTDIGLSAVMASAIILIPKLWDAVNDIIFGYIVDRYKFKNGQKFVPWVKIGVSTVGIATIVLFAIPSKIENTAKIIWFLIAYFLFDVSYTILDTTSFSLATVMTSDLDERTSVIAKCKLWSMVGAVLATVLIPLVRPSIGWFKCCVIFIVISVIMMFPMPFIVKERATSLVQANVEPTFREIIFYLKNNKYLIVALVAMLIFGISSVEQTMAIYMGRICLNNESTTSLVAGGVALSVITVSWLVPKLAKRWDKFYILIIGCSFSVCMNIVSYFVGYGNLILAIVMITVKCTGLGFWQVIIYMIVADTIEYGTYKTGIRSTGITFSLQLFIAKLKNAIIGSFVLLSLAFVGFVEGENVVQPEGVADKVWGLFHLLPAVGFALAIIILLAFYKLRTKDVKIMVQYNNGEIDRNVAEALLSEKYGKAPQNFERELDYLSRWMQFISDDALLRKIVIPGSHDSGTKGMLWAWETQNYDIYQQLIAGVRYFDIRVHKKGTKYLIFHKLSDGMAFEPILEKIKLFLSEHSSEVVLLDFQHFKGNSQKEVERLLLEILGSDNLIVSNSSKDGNLDFIHNLKLKQVRGKCIIFWGDRNYPKRKHLFTRNNNMCTAGEQCLDSYYIARIHKSNAKKLIKTGHPEYFKRAYELEKIGKSGIFVLQCQLTDGLIFRGPYRREKSLNKPMSKHIRSLRQHPNFDLVNVIMRDFINPEKTIDIIRLNCYKGILKSNKSEREI